VSICGSSLNSSSSSSSFSSIDLFEFVLDSVLVGRMVAVVVVGLLIVDLPVDASKYTNVRNDVKKKKKKNHHSDIYMNIITSSSSETSMLH
jgi:hypothetical protein